MPLLSRLPRILVVALALTFLLDGAVIQAVNAGERVTAHTGHVTAADGCSHDAVGSSHDGSCCNESSPECGCYAVSNPLMAPHAALRVPPAIQEPQPLDDPPRAVGSQAAPFRPPA